MYGRSFESKYTGSLVGAGCNVFAVWDYVLTMTHRGYIDLNPKLLAAILGGDEPEIVAAIDFLCAPDPDSRSSREEGRRMVKEGKFQYRVVNWEEYQGISNAEDLKEYNRRKQAEYRARKKQEQDMTPKQLEAFEAARKKEYARRRRYVKREGMIAGAGQALKEGLAEANGDTSPIDRI